MHYRADNLAFDAVRAGPAVFRSPLDADMSAMTHQIDRLGAGRRVDDSEAFAAGRSARRSPAVGLTPTPHHSTATNPMEAHWQGCR